MFFFHPERNSALLVNQKKTNIHTAKTLRVYAYGNFEEGKERGNKRQIKETGTKKWVTALPSKMN